MLGKTMRELLDVVGEAGVEVVAASGWEAGTSSLVAKREATG
jgi:hypothetical protein